MLRLAKCKTSSWPALSAVAAMRTTQRSSTSRRYNVKRIDYPWKAELQRDAWSFLKQEMVAHFQNSPARDSTIHIRAEQWPRFAMKEELLENGRLPAVICKSGPSRKITFNKTDMEQIAFDEPNGHLSNLFKGRLFRLHVDNWVEDCVVSDVSTHAVEQELYFVRFERHVPGNITTLPIPVSLSGLWGCPGYRSGGHVELSMPTIHCEVVGEKIPPPFIVDVTGLRLEAPYGKITLSELSHALPSDGTVRFSRHYQPEEEVVTCYDPKALGEVPLPHDWQDPNFDHRGGRYHLTYTGYWPKQTTRQ